ncbi:MAG: peptidyl-prolyl cis-trans isomerase [Burkholderiales bacterium]|nr:MAG: peptidyl-prolyl cis-trans isomerase [Burkholderiales bacterium]
MFESIRNHKKFLLGFLMILIVPSFVLFGVEGYTRYNEASEAVATVDGEKITKAEWDQAHQQESQRLREMMPTIDSRLLDSDQARYETLERLVRQRVLAVAADKGGLYTSDQRLARELQANEVIATLRRPDGSLDVEAYRQLLARQGLSPEMFEAQVRAELSQQQVLQGIEGTGLSAAAVADAALNAFFERREVRVQRLEAGDFRDRVTLSDADIEAFYSANGALFQAPEQADVEYLVLDSASIEKGIALNEADLRTYYEQNAQALSGPEERRASHILLTWPEGETGRDAVRERARDLLAQARQNPDGFADLARQHSQDPGSGPAGGDLDYFSRGAMVKPFEDAVFALEKDAISELVETEFGVHIIRLTDIRKPPQRSFESLRAELETTLRQQQAQRLFAEQAENFSNTVYEQSDSLQPAAEAFKLEIRRADGVQREPAPGATGPLANARLLEALFSIDAIERKRNTEAIETASGQLTSARIVNHRPARTLPLEEVRDQVRERLVAQRAAELARAEGERRLEAWRSGGQPESLGPVLTVSREAPQGLPPAVLTAALSAPAGALPAWQGVPLGEAGYAVVKVEKVLPRQPRTEAALAEQELAQYSRLWSAAEAQAYYDTLYARFKVRVLVPNPSGSAPPAR